MSTEPIAVIIDTDIGNDPDDLLALAMALDRPEFDLRAVVTTGSVPALRAWFVDRMCRVAERDVPVFAGRLTPGTREPNPMHTAFFGDPAPGWKPPAGDFDAFVRDVIDPMEDGSTYLLTIGPLSTLAELLERRPRVGHRFREVVSMGGFYSPDPEGRFVREYNFGADAESARSVLSRSFPHTCVTKNVCDGVRMLPSDLGRLRGCGTPARAWAGEFMREYFRHRPEKILHDPLTVVAAYDPGPLELQAAEVTVRSDGLVGSTLLEGGPRRVSVGAAPEDPDWFERMFYD